MVIKILFSIFACFAIINAVSKLKQKKLKIVGFMLWLIFWLGIIFFVWQPDLSDNIASFLGVGRGADALIYIALVSIFYLLFKIYTKLEKNHQDITKLARSIAILEKETKK